MTFREFTGKNVEEAIRSAMKEFSAELADLDIEILSQGSRGILGVGGEEARILAAPKAAVAAAETVRAPRDETPPPEPAPRRSPRRPAPAEEGPVGEQLADVGSAEVAPRRDRGPRSGGGRGRPDREPRVGRGERPFRDRPAREPREDRPAREPAPFIPGKPLEELS